MAAEHPARFDLLPMWSKLNGMLVELVDFVPEERMEWSPKPELWTFRHLFQHLCEAREQWMVRAIDDGAANIDVYANVHSKEELKAAFGTTWERIAAVFADQGRLDATYRDQWWKEAPLRDGHWVAFHLLEHDLHHRAEVLLYLALLGIETPQVWVP